jgi:hypothetical protein
VIKVVDKLNAMRGKKSIFLKEYAKDLEKISVNQLEMTVRIAGQDVGILVSVLASHLSNVGAASLSETSRQLFTNIDFVKCFSNNRYLNITEELFVLLNNNHNADFKSAVNWISCHARVSSEEKIEHPARKYPVMVNLPLKDFLPFEWDTLIEFLSSSDKVDNLYQFFEAIYLWLHVPEDDRSINPPRLDFTHDHVIDIIDIKKDRCWEKISKGYLEAVSTSREIGSDKLVDLFLKSDELSMSCSNGVLFTSWQEFNIVNVFTEELFITLVSDDKVASCAKDTKCAFMLHITPYKNIDDEYNHFSLTVEYEKNENEEFHYHDFLVESHNFGILIEVISAGSVDAFPIPFNTYPCKDSVNSIFWNWGFLQFREHGKPHTGCPCQYIYSKGINTKVNFIVS